MNYLRILYWLLLGFVTLLVAGCQSPSYTQQPERFQQLYDSPVQLPDVVSETYPEASSVVSLDMPVNIRAPVESSRAICVSVQIEPLLEPGDNLERAENVQLTLDTRIVSKQPQHTILPMQVNLLAENGATLATGVANDVLCWNRLLSIGEHLAEFQIWSTSGKEYSYEWAFEVVE